MHDVSQYHSIGWHDRYLAGEIQPDACNGDVDGCSPGKEIRRYAVGKGSPNNTKDRRAQQCIPFLRFGGRPEHSQHRRNKRCQQVSPINDEQRIGWEQHIAAIAGWTFQSYKAGAQCRTASRTEGKPRNPVADDLQVFDDQIGARKHIRCIDLAEMLTLQLDSLGCAVAQQIVWRHRMELRRRIPDHEQSRRIEPARRIQG